MRSVALVAAGVALLVLQSTLATLVTLHPFVPNLLLPVVIFLGVSPDVGLARGAAVAFALGYLLDAFCGYPMGLQTFLMVATFLVARVAGLRLFLRGPAFQVLLTFLVGVLDGGTVLALRAIFEPRAPFGSATVAQSLAIVLAPAVVTALASPFVFALVRRVDALGARGREEAAA